MSLVCQEERISLDEVFCSVRAAEIDRDVAVGATSLFFSF